MHHIERLVLTDEAALFTRAVKIKSALFCASPAVCAQENFSSSTAPIQSSALFERRKPHTVGVCASELDSHCCYALSNSTSSDHVRCALAGCGSSATSSCGSASKVEAARAHGAYIPEGQVSRWRVENACLTTNWWTPITVCMQVVHQDRASGLR